MIPFDRELFAKIIMIDMVAIFPIGTITCITSPGCFICILFRPCVLGMLDDGVRDGRNKRERMGDKGISNEKGRASETN